MVKTGGQTLVQALEHWGVEVVFGIPGIHTLAIYDALYDQSAIRHVTARHEQGAGFMADGYARSSAKVGVVLTTTGPAAVNALTPLAEAWADSSAVLLVCSGPSTAEVGRELGALHEMRDQFATLVSVCGRGRRVESVEAIPAAVDEAFAHLLGGRPRPYVLEVPWDLLDASAQVASCQGRWPALARPASGALERVAALLAAARYPLIFAGGGAQNAAAEIEQVAERLGALVGLSVNGLGVLPADHPLLCGDAASAGLSPQQRNLGKDIGPWLERADLTLAVGTRLAERTVRAWQGEPKRLVQLDIDPQVVGRAFTAEIGLVGDAKAVLTDLLKLLPDEPSAAKWDAAEARQAPKEEEGGVFATILAAVRQVLPRDGIVCNDMTGISYQARRHFPVYSPRSFISPHYYGTLGFSLPAAIGAKLAWPRRPVVSLVGDGGFMFTMQELATAAQEELCLPIVLCNDRRYTAIQKMQERRFGQRFIAVDLNSPDFVGLAQSFGIGATRAAPRELGPALREAFAAQGPTLIEVPVPR